jgi:Tfp pilus assembly protein PilW
MVNPAIAQTKIPRSEHSGLTIIELLVTSIIGLILILMTLTIFTSHMRTSAQMEAYNRLQQHWKRIQFLIEQDISESTGQATTAAPCGSGTNHLSISFEKVDTSSLTGTVPAGTVTYYLSGHQFRWCIR